MVFQLRQRWHSLFLRRIRCPSKPWSQLDEATIRAIVSVLTAEEQAASLQQPMGIGQRPKPITPDEPQHQSNSRRNNSGHRSVMENCETPTPDRYEFHNDQMIIKMTNRLYFEQDNYVVNLIFHKTIIFGL